jgi:H+/Cl- antiporter ClcA
MSDWLFFLICALVSGATGAALQRYRPAWARRRALLVAAAPLPRPALVACVLVFISGAITSREHCGVDACGMAIR